MRVRESRGEWLRGLGAAELARIVDGAEADAMRLAKAGLGDVVVETDRRMVAEIADAVGRRVGGSGRH